VVPLLPNKEQHVKWIIALPDGRQYGPFTSHDLRNLAASGQLKPDHQVCAENGNSWYLAHKLKGLFPNVRYGSDEMLVDMETGFQPATHGSLRPSDGCAAGVRRLAFSRFGLVLIFGFGCWLAYRHYSRPVANSISSGHAETHLVAAIPAPELPTRMEKWKERRAQLGTLLASLERDRIQILERLKSLGVTSVEQIAANSRAKVYAEELRDVLKQKESLQKQLDQYELAILKAEFRQRSTERRLSTQAINDKDLDELAHDAIILDARGASERRTHVPLELDGALIKELENVRNGSSR
jgi:hypothetical protein